MTSRITALKNRFFELFGREPQTVTKGPGRLDLMGNHTDYNDGFVLPVAVDFEVIAAGRLRDDNLIRAYTVNLDSAVEFSLGDIRFDEVSKWSNYLRGMLVYLREAGVELRGADVALEGNVPVASGLSSSAAIEMAVGTLFQSMLGFEMTGADMALVGQRAENRFVGVNTGIMDQFISRLGKKGHALFLDCRTLDYEHVPLDTKEIKIVICDTMKRRGLVDSEYNARRAQCEEAVRVLGKYLRGIKALRDVSLDDLNEYGDHLTELVAKRARHVVTENERGIMSRKFLLKHDIESFARLMDESQDSARDDYEVSCYELDTMVEVSRGAPGALCSRMIGAGFGGATSSLVHKESVEEFTRVVSEGYEKKTGVDPRLYVCTAEDGAGVIE